MEEKTTENQETLSANEKEEMLKALFGSLEVDEKAIFADWCHEEVKKGASKYLGQKMVKMNEDVNRVVSKLYDKVIKTETKIYDETNDRFDVVSDDEDKGENSSKGFFD